MVGKYVPIEDVAKHFSVSISTIRAWVRQKEIPEDTYIKVGNTYRFNIDDVSDALTNKSKSYQEETETFKETETEIEIEDDVDEINLDKDY
tara:strand:- start:3760 stop:4032 length:273 start_codon:yes stop_codon:yes gene_type:complete